MLNSYKLPFSCDVSHHQAMTPTCCKTQHRATAPQGSLLLRAWRACVHLLKRSCLLCFLLVASLLLSGCVRYDVGIRFDSPNRGEIVQHLHIEERLKRFSDGTVQQWLALIEARTHQLGGELEHLPDDDRLVRIPFTSSGDLQTKFNQFFSPVEGDRSASALPSIAAQLTIATSNLLLVERNHLRYDIDLRSLGVLSSSGSLLLSPASLIDLEFRLQTAWGAHSIAAATNQPVGQRAGKTLVWQLVPGEENHLEAVFWLPSPLGIGTLAIALLVALGSYLKYPRPITTPIPEGDAGV